MSSTLAIVLGSLAGYLALAQLVARQLRRRARELPPAPRQEPPEGHGGR